MGKVLTRDEILGANDFRIEEVNVPEWGGIVKVKSLSAAERDEFEISIGALEDEKKRDFRNLRAKLVALSVVGEDGKRLFMLEDVIKLGDKNARALDRVFAVAQRLSGLTKKDIDELTKNSGGQSGDSSSG